MQVWTASIINVNDWSFRGASLSCGTYDTPDRVALLKAEIAELDKVEKELDQHKNWVQQSIKNVTDDLNNHQYPSGFLTWNNLSGKKTEVSYCIFSIWPILTTSIPNFCMPACLAVFMCTGKKVYQLFLVHFLNLLSGMHTWRMKIFAVVFTATQCLQFRHLPEPNWKCRFQME